MVYLYLQKQRRAKQKSLGQPMLVEPRLNRLDICVRAVGLSETEPYAKRSEDRKTASIDT